MNFSDVEKIADTVLYEGYILYPYRASSTKNRQRWNFGTLYPKQYAEALRPAESFQMTTECLVKSGVETKLDIRVRFLQLVEGEGRGDDTSWQEGVDRSKDFSNLDLNDVLVMPSTVQFTFVAGETVTNAQGVSGRLNLGATRTPEGLIKLHLELVNVTDVEVPSERNHVLLQSFTSAHVLLGVQDGEFVSLLDPPAEYRSAVGTCLNVGVFPVLAGREGRHTMMLCSPIILYDYPEVAAESAGDFFDSTEMDEMLALRVLTLTDDEKREMLQDDRSRKILERTESLPPEHMMKVHGATRGLRRVKEES